MRFILLFIFIKSAFISCSQNLTKEEIIKKYSTNCAEKYNYNYQMEEWQKCLDKGLALDSTIAYLWQQKAMPYFKARKYQIGMKFQDKAVLYDREGQQDYRAFIKCIFSKEYEDAIADFEDYKKDFGNHYVMDHTYDFYIAISCLQLNQFEKAEKLLTNYLADLQKELGEEWLHPTALFYLGISKMELKKYQEAIATFDKALKIYPNFSDVEYYKGICLLKLGEKTKAKKIFAAYKIDAENGFSINEDNAIYEMYPYQLRKRK